MRANPCDRTMLSGGDFWVPLLFHQLGRGKRAEAAQRDIDTQKEDGQGLMLKILSATW